MTVLEGISNFVRLSLIIFKFSQIFHGLIDYISVSDSICFYQARFSFQR
jgi:hypothetical protein